MNTETKLTTTKLTAAIAAIVAEATTNATLRGERKNASTAIVELAVETGSEGWQKACADLAAGALSGSLTKKQARVVKETVGRYGRAVSAFFNAGLEIEVDKDGTPTMTLGAMKKATKAHLDATAPEAIRSYENTCFTHVYLEVLPLVGLPENSGLASKLAELLGSIASLYGKSLPERAEPKAHDLPERAEPKAHDLPERAEPKAQKKAERAKARRAA